MAEKTMTLNEKREHYAAYQNCIDKIQEIHESLRKEVLQLSDFDVAEHEINIIRRYCPESVKPIAEAEFNMIDLLRVTLLESAPDIAS